MTVAGNTEIQQPKKEHDEKKKLFQSVTKFLFQSASGISKCDNYFKV